jgi:hypothetical protein
MRRLLILLVGLTIGCAPELPDPESPGAVVLSTRCGGCHRVHAPGTMTFAMWMVQLDRMKRLYARQGLPWLSAADERALLSYLEANASRPPG